MPDNPDTALPADIAAAIDRLLDCDRRLHRDVGTLPYVRAGRDEARAALDAAILARLTAAEAERDEAKAMLHALRQNLNAVWADNASLRERLESLGA
jgi:hypothetical protein